MTTLEEWQQSFRYWLTSYSHDMPARGIPVNSALDACVASFNIRTSSTYPPNVLVAECVYFAKPRKAMHTDVNAVILALAKECVDRYGEP